MTQGLRHNEHHLDLHSSSSDLLESLDLSRFLAPLLQADDLTCPAKLGVQTGPRSVGREGAAVVGGLPRRIPPTPSWYPHDFQAN